MALGGRKSQITAEFVREFLSLNPDGVSAVTPLSSTEMYFSRRLVSFDVLEGYDVTSIWQSLAAVATDIPDVDVPKRILVVTDGNDTAVTIYPQRVN
jgi:hypothetical protein